MEALQLQIKRDPNLEHLESALENDAIYEYILGFTVDNTIFPWVPNLQKPHGMISLLVQSFESQCEVWD